MSVRQKVILISKRLLIVTGRQKLFRGFNLCICLPLSFYVFLLLYSSASWLSSSSALSFFNCCCWFFSPPLNISSLDRLLESGQKLTGSSERRGALLSGLSVSELDAFHSLFHACIRTNICTWLHTLWHIHAQRKSYFEVEI